MAPLKLCKDCKHMRPNDDPKYASFPTQAAELAKCHHVSSVKAIAITSLVTGRASSVEYEHCYKQRYTEVPSDQQASVCGLEGQYFEAVESAPKEATKEPLLKLPKHSWLTIEHNPHLAVGDSVAEWLALVQADPRDVLLEDRRQMIATGTVWHIEWAPPSTWGYHAVAAATLERALELANKNTKESV